MILTENELFAQFVLLSGSKIYFFWQKYTSQSKCFFGSLSDWSLWSWYNWQFNNCCLFSESNFSHSLVSLSINCQFLGFVIFSFNGIYTTHDYYFEAGPGPQHSHRNCALFWLAPRIDYRCDLSCKYPRQRASKDQYLARDGPRSCS